MRKYSPNVASRSRIDYGIELIAGLNAFPATVPLAIEFKPINDALSAAFNTRIALNTPVLRTRAELRIGEFLAEQDIRTFSRALEIHEGARRGPAHDYVFPNGVNPIVARRRGDQVREMRGLIHRVTSCPIAIDPTFIADWVPRFTAATERLEAAVAAFEAAAAAYNEAFAIEMHARAAHAHAIDRLIGQTRAVFPSDPARQDVVFPPVASRSRPKDETEIDLTPAVTDLVPVTPTVAPPAIL